MKTIITTKKTIASETGAFVPLVWTADGEDLLEIKSDDDAEKLALRFGVPVELIGFILLNLKTLRDSAQEDLKDLHTRLEKLEKAYG